MNEQDMFHNEMAMQNAVQFGNRGYLSPMQSQGGSILILTNPENELYKLELALRNMRLNEKGEPIPNGLPLMNDEGVSSVLGQVQAVVNQVTVVSNFKDKNIEGLIDYLADTLARDLMMSRIKYDIKNGYDRDRIYFQSLTTAFVTMQRALDEGERRFWKGSQQEITTRVEGMKGQSKGFFSSLMKGSFK